MYTPYVAVASTDLAEGGIGLGQSVPYSLPVAASLPGS